MVAIPFIYFTALMIFLYKRNGNKYDLACYILSIFAVSGFLSILMDLFDLREPDTYGYVISFNATFAYCGLITLCLIPFIHYSHTAILCIKPIKTGVVMIKILAWSSVLFFLLSFILSWSDVVSALTDDMGQTRSTHYMDEDGGSSWLRLLPFGIKQICVFLNIILGIPWILQFLAFYSLCILRQKEGYAVCLFIGSLSGLLNNILAAGRSGFVFWGLSLIACFIVFKPFLT